MDKNTLLISVPILFREIGGKLTWFVTKEVDGGTGWEFMKVLVRKGESSVRASLRVMGEKGGMTVKILEEVGRLNTVKTTENKTVNQRQIYYIMVLKSGSKDAIGFGEYHWLEYIKAVSKLTSKKDKSMLKDARDYLKKWKKDHPGKKL